MKILKTQNHTILVLITFSKSKKSIVLFSNNVLKSFTALMLFAFSIGTISAQDFYELETIQNIEINFSQSNWDELMDDQKEGDENYIMAQTVVINGEVFDSVGVKYKGNSTYNPNQTKNPLHIELDTYKSQNYQGYRDIKLSNGAKDPSFLREVLSYQILRQYADAPLSNYANVTINGELIGLYSNSESISKRFVDKYFDSRTNAFIKCNPIGGAGPGSSDFPNLAYLGNNVSSYVNAYEIKSDEGWDDLLNLCDTLNNEIGAIHEILDVDRALWMLAFDNALVNLDSYIGAFVQNYYLYRDDYGRFIPVVWDLNESFGRFSQTGSSNLTSTTAKQELDVFLHENNSSYPLIQQLLSVPTYRKRYLAHFKTMMLENFENGAYAATGQTLQDLIAESVDADENQFFSYNNFLDNLQDDISGGGGGPGGGGGGTPGIVNLMDGRTDYLLNTDEFSAPEPVISNINLSSAIPELGETLLISAEISDANYASMAYRFDEGAPFVELEMFDDGTNGDETAGDGTFSLAFPLQHTFYEYYFYAENSDIGKFDPQRAEHEFYSLEAVIPTPDISELVINEFMASNFEWVADSEGEFDDWIELYNNGANAIDLSGYTLSDDAGQLSRWSFPAGTSIAAGGYLIVWADKDEEQAGLHANFKLSASAEGIFLSDPAGEVVDLITYQEQLSDVAFARFPNGTGDFMSMNPTFGAENVIVTGVPEALTAANQFHVYPNPVVDALCFELAQTDLENAQLRLFDLNGKLLYTNDQWNGQTIYVSEYANGFYFVSVNRAGLSSTRKFLIQR